MEDVSINLWPPHKYTQIKNKDHEVAQQAKISTPNSELSSVRASLKYKKRQLAVTFTSITK